MDNIYSAYHYACKTKADKEAVEQIYEEVKKSAQNAIYRNIGDIFFTARTDTEINGAVECNGGTYSTADFEGKQNVGNLLANGSLPYVSLSEYESLVSTNGSCRAFGWDGGDSFRVPTIPALLLTKEQSAVCGNGMTLGLTDGTSKAGIRNETGYYMAIDTSVYGKTIGTAGTGAYVNTNKSVGITTDPTKSGIVANLDVIEYRAMVQLANGATDQAVITATSALQQVANKAERDLSNISEDALARVTTGYPTQEVIPQTWGTWIAPDNGFACANSKNSGDDHAYCFIYNTTTNMGAYGGAWNGGSIKYCSIAVSKGDVVTCGGNKLSGPTTFFVRGK